MNYILSIFGIGSTKKTTDTTNKYDPQSMNIFHQLGGSGNNVMQEYMKDPLKASYFQNQVGILNRFTQQAGLRNVSALLSQRGSGVNNAGWMNSNVARIGRNTGSSQAQNVLQALMNAESRRYSAAGNALNYHPLQTGQKTTEETGGLGTWLPQVIGMGASAALAFGTGGASAAAKGMSTGAKIGIAGAGAAANTFFNRGPSGYTPEGYTGPDNRQIA